MSSDNDMATPISSPRCEYIFRNKYGQKGEGAQCSEHAYADGKCLLHVGLPAGSEFKDLVVKKAERTVEKAPSAEPKGQGSLPSKSLKCYSRRRADTTQKSLRLLCWKHTKVVLPGGRAVVYCRNSHSVQRLDITVTVI